MKPAVPLLDVPRDRELTPDLLEIAVQVLTTEGLLIYPTDTLYALGGRALAPAVARRVREAKGREEAKALPLVAADLSQVRRLTCEWTGAVEALAARFWPGPLTLVLRATADVPSDVSAGQGTVAVRVPDVVLVRQLCAAAGPLISTSANRTGGAPATTCAEALAAVGGAVALALDGGAARVSTPSTIVDLSGGEPSLLRPGAIDWGEIVAVLKAATDRITSERA